jgi:hypothetical protein
MPGPVVTPRTWGVKPGVITFPGSKGAGRVPPCGVLLRRQPGEAPGINCPPVKSAGSTFQFYLGGFTVIIRFAILQMQSIAEYLHRPLETAANVC